MPFLVTAAAIAFAVLLVWSSNWLARLIVRRYERRTPPPDSLTTQSMMTLKRRETVVSVVRTSVRYVSLVICVLVAVGELSNSTSTAVAGASIVVLLIGFAGQRFLTDILAGLLMLFEGWFSVGDMVVVEPWALTGVVEEVSLRSTALRALSGDLIRVHNSQILALRVVPRGAKEVQIELFFRDGDTGRERFEEVAALVPVGPTNFVRRPWVSRVDTLDDDLVRITAGAFVPPGREWLAKDLLAALLRERDADDLVHGPVVTEVDPIASARFERATSLSRRPA
jgi:Mechanosensitive ion channel